MPTGKDHLSSLTYCLSLFPSFVPRRTSTPYSCLPLWVCSSSISPGFQSPLHSLPPPPSSPSAHTWVQPSLAKPLSLRTRGASQTTSCLLRGRTSSARLQRGDTSASPTRRSTQMRLRREVGVDRASHFPRFSLVVLFCTCENHERKKVRRPPGVLRLPC